MANATDAGLQEILEALSLARISTYEQAAGAGAAEAVELYAWNVQVSAAFLLPLHIVEVVTRNAATEGILTLYGPRWPWSHGFELSLTDTQRGYMPRRDLRGARRNQPTAGKVIPELKFVFWQKIFTARFDARLWEPQILGLFPNSSHTDAASVRGQVYGDLERIRLLRNRIAHHEPIFARDLTTDLETIVELVRFRSTATADWLLHHEAVTDLLNQHP